MTDMGNYRNLQDTSAGMVFFVNILCHVLVGEEWKRNFVNSILSKPPAMNKCAWKKWIKQDCQEVFL